MMIMTDKVFLLPSESNLFLSHGIFVLFCSVEPFKLCIYLPKCCFDCAYCYRVLNA